VTPDLSDSLELVADGLNFPTSIAFDDDGIAYIAESGLPFGGNPPGGTILRLEPGGNRTVLAEGLREPVNGLAFHHGAFYVSEGGHPARLSRLATDGTVDPLVDGLPGPGNYQLNMAVVGPDQRLYFSQGAMSNLGIVGLDSYDIGWLRRLPHGHDLPGYAVTLAGFNVQTDDPTADAPGATAVTGAFAPFGTATAAGELVEAALPATAAVMSCNLDGSDLRLVAWGLRNAYGLGFLPDGRLLAVDQGADDRGSRPIGNAPDALFEVRPGAWYGWPDFVAGAAVTDPRFAPARGAPPQFLLQDHDRLPAPERPLLEFPPHTAAVKFAPAPVGSQYDGSVLVALFGDEAPMTAPAGARVGRGVALVDTDAWELSPLVSGDPLQRPIDVRIHAGHAYIVDFGHFEMTVNGVDATAGSGCVWRLPLEE
jgi:glucose/arabinose dehydrogenase